MRKRYVAPLCALVFSMTLLGCEVNQTVAPTPTSPTTTSPTTPTPTGGVVVTEVTLSTPDVRITLNACPASINFTATVHGTGVVQEVWWTQTGGGTFTEGVRTATLSITTAGTYVVRARARQNEGVSGQVTVTATGSCTSIAPPAPPTVSGSFDVTSFSCTVVGPFRQRYDLSHGVSADASGYVLQRRQGSGPWIDQGSPSTRLSFTGEIGTDVDHDFQVIAIGPHGRPTTRVVSCPRVNACSDLGDNDRDGRIDRNDPGCYPNGSYDPNDNDETDPPSTSGPPPSGPPPSGPTPTPTPTPPSGNAIRITGPPSSGPGAFGSSPGATGTATAECSTNGGSTWGPCANPWWFSSDPSKVQIHPNTGFMQRFAAGSVTITVQWSQYQMSPSASRTY